MREKHKDYDRFPEFGFGDRVWRIYDWIPDNGGKILDAGCSWGYSTRFFGKKAGSMYGLDPNQEYIKVAGGRYREVNFQVSGVENTGFKDGFFDTVILSDVLEHLKDEERALNELYRILKKNGIMIITTPHKGLFGFMDPERYIFKVQKYLPWLYGLIYQIKNGVKFPGVRPGYDIEHRHYSINDFRKMLDSSDFRNHFEILDFKRTGLFINPFTSNLELFARFLPFKKLTSILLKPFGFLSAIDYRISYGIFSYNIALKIRKI